MRQTYITASHLVDDYRKALLEGREFALGVQVRPFNFAFSEASLDRKSIEVAIYHALKKQTFTKLNDVLNYPKTIQSFMALLDEMDAYGVSLSDLPKATPLQREIAQVMTIVRTMIPEPIIGPQSYIAYDQGLSHAHRAFLARHEIPLASRLPMEPTSIRFRVALNIRSEIESVIQDILERDIKDAVVAIPNFNAHHALIEATLARYGLHQKFSDKRFDLAKAQFLAMVTLALDNSVQSVLALIEANPLKLQFIDDLVYYIQHFELTYAQLFEPFNHAQAHPDYPQIYRLQEHIQSDVLTLQQFLLDLSTKDYVGALTFAYDTLALNSRIDIRPIKSFLESHMHLYDASTHLFFMNHFKNVQSRALTQHIIRWIDIRELPYLAPQHLYVLGLSAKQFPAIASRTGILDESYVAQIQNFPSLDVRTQYLLDQQNIIFTHSTHLTLSYHASSYEGKGIEVSYPIERFCADRNIQLEPWTLKQISERTPVLRSLSPDLAPQIYLKDGKIVGSISAFQMYINNPYQFFVERGLALREPEKFTFDPRVIGTINHRIMETMHKQLPNDAWDTIGRVFPQNSNRIKMIQQRNEALMTMNIDFVKESIATSTFDVADTEKWFEADSLFKNIHLRGIIDRIDLNDNHALIVDYKSTAQSLSQGSVQSGQQLQLLTYAMICETLFSKSVLGVFYFGLRNSNISLAPLSYNMSKGVIYNEELPEDLWKKQKKYSGWMFDLPEEMFETDAYYGGLRLGKMGMGLWRKPFDMDKIRPLLHHVYDTIQFHILSGILDPEAITIDVDKDLNLRKDDDA